MKGSYVLVIALRTDEAIRVGALGTIDFPRGYYAHAGSAQGGIEQRVSRHMAGDKKKRWHIDYLLEKAEVQSTIFVPVGGKEMECKVARILVAIQGARLIARGFGSSDCSCEGHLVYLGASDDALMALEEVLFRMCTLESVYPYSVDG